MTRMATTATGGAIAAQLNDVSPTILRKIIPAASGTTTVPMIVLVIGQHGIGRKTPPKNSTRRGVTRGESIVDIVVSATEKAAAPPARNPIKLLAMAPGTHPTRMKQRASSSPTLPVHATRNTISDSSVHDSATPP